MKRLLLIIGTRPEAIKTCVLIKELKNRKDIDLKVLSTGQHKDMLDEVLKYEDIRVDFDLSLMKRGQKLSYLTERILNRVGRILDELLPDFVLVHGDTVTAFAGALAAFYKGIPVCHVEAGLRTYDKHNPYPEEFNRAAISRMASYHFAPTEENKRNLICEGIDEASIFVTGNTVIDALRKNVDEKYEDLRLPSGDFLILTAHRRENLGEGMREVFSAVSTLATEERISVVYPVHKNEKILPLAEEVFYGNAYVKLTEPLGVRDFHNFLSKCKFVITDSGGIQEEAAYLGKPLLITRKTTERKELFTNCGAKLVGTDKEHILSEAKKLLNDNEYYCSSSVPSKVFGDGCSSHRIADILVSLP